ncbi:MAG: hypothetical protein J0L51_11910 [Rhizobiales bacterium]|nr:hypothetical protein [Hyphomicrobiales bacterium]
MLARTVAACLFGMLVAIPAPAWACTCADDRAELSSQTRGASQNRESSPQRFERAKIVLRGKVLSARAGEDVVFPESTRMTPDVASATTFSARAVVADFRVLKAIKGTASGNVKLYSGFGIGDCGFGGGFLMAVALDREFSLEVTSIPNQSDSFVVSMCSYIEMHEPERQKQ